MWKYEQEMRLFSQINDPPDPNGLNWKPFEQENFVLREVIVGCISGELGVAKVAAQHQGAQFFQARMKPNAFALYREPYPKTPAP